MPSVEELLNQTSEEVEAYADTGIEYCTVDDDTRLVTIPDKYKKLGVESDEKAKRIWFRFPKLVGNNGVDLSAIGVRVNFRNANGEGDIYIVEDLTTDGDYVTFSWELTRKVTAYKGNVSFVVCAVKSNTDGTTKNEWNTALNKECEVLEGLEVTEQIEQENPDIIEYILANLGGSVSAEQIAQAVEEYLAENPPSGMTAEEKEQLDKNTEDISSLSQTIDDLTVGMDVSQLTLSVSAIDGGNRLKLSDGTTEKYVDIPAVSVTDEQITTIVNTWLDEHPEASTTVQDGSIALKHLASDVNEVLFVEIIEDNANNSSGSAGSSGTITGGLVAYDLTDNMSNNRFTPVVGETLTLTAHTGSNYSYIPVKAGKEYTVKTITRNSYTGGYVAFTDDNLTVLSIGHENTGAVTGDTDAVTFTAPEGATLLHVYGYLNAIAYTNQMYVTSEESSGESSGETETPEETTTTKLSPKQYVDSLIGVLPTIEEKTTVEVSNEVVTTETEESEVSFDLIANASLGYEYNYLYGVHSTTNGTASAHTCVDVSNLVGKTVNVKTASRNNQAIYFAFFTNAEDIVISQFCDNTTPVGKTYEESAIVPYGATKLYISCYRNGYSTVEDILSIASITYTSSEESGGETETPETTVTKLTVGEWIERLQGQIDELNGGLTEVSNLIGGDA